MLQEEEVDFDAYTAAVEEKEQSDAQNNQNNQGFEFPTCVQVGSKAIVRFVNGIAETATDQGKPGSGRAKLFNMGWVKDDNGKNFPLCLPPIVQNKPMYPHIMYDFIDKVLSRTWVDNPDPSKKGSWKYFYADRDDYGAKSSGEMTLKDIYWNVFKSGHKEGEQYYESQKTWRGQTVYVANVIDRNDYKWHQENKKTKLLMRSLKLKGDRLNHKEVSLYAIGGPLQELADNHGFKLNYDVLIVPGEKSLDKFKLYNVTKLKNINYWDDVSKIITEADKNVISTNTGFTAEEATWDTIDIDKYYHYTSYTTILKHFGKTIRCFDDMVGTTFYDQMKVEADREAAERKARQDAKKAAEGTTEAAPATESKPTVAESIPASQPQQSIVTPKEEPKPAETTVASSAPSFDNMQSVPTDKPEEMPISDDAKEDISSFYDSLDDDE